jgi:hypothetical protein
MQTHNESVVDVGDLVDEELDTVSVDANWMPYLHAPRKENDVLFLVDRIGLGVEDWEDCNSRQDLLRG